MRSLYNILQALVGILLVGLTLTGPAAAWDTHEIAHLSSPVAADVHHHHDEDGGVADVDHHGDGKSHDDGDGGHDHMPSLLAALSGLTSEGPVLAVPPLHRAPLAMTADREPPNILVAPHNRPPRFA